MLLTQTFLLSLALSINAREIRGRNLVERSKNGSGKGSSVSNGTVANTAVAAVSSAVSSSIDTAVAAAATAASSSGNGATLLAANIQSASDSTGGAIEEAGQSNSATDPDNFINFCSGKTVTNGLQVTAGSCNGIVMGDIPSSANMISTIITNPAPGDTVPANTNFTVNLQVSNLNAGSFTNPDTTYYAAPQALKNGNVVGHTHITIQTLGSSLTATTPPDAATFAFFKGVNDDGNGQGGLNATVAGGLAAGAYRVCTMTSASNHQPVLMPVAQRGAQDDCTKFFVSDTGAASAGTGAEAAGSSSSTAAAVATSSEAATSTGNTSTASTGATSTTGGKAKAGGGSRKSGGRRGRFERFSAREFVA